MEKKKALIVSGGVLRGAYDAGVLATLCRILGPDYFDTVYMSSVGAYTGTFYVSNQPDEIENTWRNLVCGTKLISLLNPLKKRHLLDLEYLNTIFQNEKSCLNIDAVLKSPTKLIYCLTEKDSFNPVYFNSDGHDIFSLMRAATTIPVLHSPAVIDGRQYVDSSLSDPLPILKALSDGHEEIIVVSNKPRDHYKSKDFKTLFKKTRKFVPYRARALLDQFDKVIIKSEEDLDRAENVRIIRPEKEIPLINMFDADKARLNACVDLGIKDAEKFLRLKKNIPLVEPTLLDKEAIKIGRKEIALGKYLTLRELKNETEN